MIRVRAVHSTALPADRHRVEQVQEIFLQSFASEAEQAARIPDLLEHPFKYRYRAVLLVAETTLERAIGFSLVLHFPEINSSLLDFTGVAPGRRGGGVGTVLYQAVREYCRAIGSRGLYMEVAPDDPAMVRDAKQLRINRQRLRFYEQNGVRPIVGTRYETPIGESPAPYLLFDGLGRSKPLRRKEARAAVRLILERKYSHLVGPDYIEMVVKSFVDDPVRFRAPRYDEAADRPHEVAAGHLEKPFALVVTRGHEIHHVKSSGYVERPVRVEALLQPLKSSGLFSMIPPRHYNESYITKVHDKDFVAYLRNVCRKLEGARPVYPYVFPIRRPDRRPKDLALRAGYYSIDTFTPLDRRAYDAARASVNAAMTAAEELLAGRDVCYALCRPPGHHAERRVFGGFCYFNNAAIAAHRLSAEGRVAVLDIDFHHGNGTQDIFYTRSDVLTVSVHGHPNYAYPYFSGFADETGEGLGTGYNRNFPLPEDCDEAGYFAALEKAAGLIERFAPQFLVLSLGFDIIKGDPTGSFGLTPGSMRKIGTIIAGLRLPTLVVQEGGYRIRNLKRGAGSFFHGLHSAMRGSNRAS